MDEDNPHLTYPFGPQPHRAQKTRGSDESSSPSFRGHRVFITHINATVIVSGLLRMPRGFYISVQMDGKTTKTPNKPLLIGKGGVEWDVDILLPSERSSSVFFKVYASFEVGPRLGNGESLGQFETTVGELLDGNEQPQSIKLRIQRDKNRVLPLNSTLSIVTEWRVFAVAPSSTQREVLYSDTVRRLVEVTDIGHHALSRYCQFLDQKDLDGAITYFERASDICPPDHPNRSTVLFNLANAKFILCQARDSDAGLDVPVTLYRDALRLHPCGHSDHCATALSLSLVLLARFERRGDEADGMEARRLLSGVVEFSPGERYEHQAASHALDTSASVPTMESGTSQTDNPAHEDAVIQIGRAMLPHLADQDPRRPTLLAALGRGLYSRSYRSGDLSDIHDAVSMLEDAERLTNDDDPEKPALLHDLGSSLLRRFEHLDDLADIDKSVAMREKAIRLIPKSHPDVPTYLNSVGISLSCRFRRFGDPSDINKSISLQEDALRLTSNNHPERPIRLIELGISLSSRFDRLGELTDINESISMQEEAVRLTPIDHPDKLYRLSNLGNSLLRRFYCLGDQVDIDKCVMIQEIAVQLTPSGHPDRPAHLSDLGSSLSSRFERFGDLADIDGSISVIEEALQLIPDGDPGRLVQLNNLGRSLSRRFERLGNLVDINKSTSMIEKALSLTPSGHPQRPAGLNNLGLSLAGRFHRLGELADLNSSISMFEEAVKLVPDENPSKPAFLNNLGRSLLGRFEHIGDLADINKSILIQDQVLCLTPNGHPEKASWWGQLGGSLFSRFEHLGDVVDIKKSILMFKEAISLTPSDHPDKPARLNALGMALLSHSKHFSDISGIHNSISMIEEAVQLTPNNHPDKSGWLNNLAISLSYCFEHFGDVVDINKSILVYEEALCLTPNDHPERSSQLNNLGVALCARFQHLGNLEDISKSISMHERAMCLTPNGHPSRTTFLNNLGSAFMQHFNHSHDVASLSSATLHFSEAACSSTGSASVRFHAACNWISSVQLEGDSQIILDAHAATIKLLPQLAWLGLPLSKRHSVLLSAANTARDAAAAAIKAGNSNMAVEWLEQGRSIVWTQLLQLRTPIDELYAQHPALAVQFQQISRKLEHIGFDQNVMFDSLKKDLLTGTMMSEEQVQRHHELALTREKLLAKIQSLPGFSQFLLPKTIKQLSALANSGPVVYINASKQHCDALIIAAPLENAILVPLSDISYEQVKQLYGALHLLLKNNHLIATRDNAATTISSGANLTPQQVLDMLSTGEGSEYQDRAVRHKPQQLAGYSQDGIFCWILAYLWEKVANPILKVLGSLSLLSNTERLTHIFWCPTGPFAFLPIHAAGLYNTSEPGKKLSDLAISSYIPTLSALAPLAEDNLQSPSKTNVHLVAIPQPSTDGLTPLVSVEKEIDHIRTLSSRSKFVTLEISNGAMEDVKKKMQQSNWVHFACHGVQDPGSPLDSGLCLADKFHLRLSDIIHLSCPKGGLAFLSACQTAQGNEKLSEESVHLAAGMLLAGYGGVIATMWAIKDSDAPKVTKDVYEYLFQDGTIPSSMEAAKALHYAIKNLQKSGAPFSSWVPFIHFGR